MSRFVDSGAIFAGWVGLGVAVVVVVAFALVLPIQVLVLLLAPVAGAIVGAYANVRSERRRPRRRVMANALWAGLVTALAMTLFYAGVRLVFFYADSGVLPTGEMIECRTGPDCGYARLVALGRGPELVALGITDAASYERAWLGEMTGSSVIIFLLTTGGAVAAGAARTFRRESASAS